jgi:hypothetical protein
VKEFKYLGRSNKPNLIHKEIKSGLNSGNARRRCEDNIKVDLRGIGLGDAAGLK